MADFFWPVRMTSRDTDPMNSFSSNNSLICFPIISSRVMSVITVYPLLTSMIKPFASTEIIPSIIASPMTNAVIRSSSNASKLAEALATIAFNS